MFRVAQRVEKLQMLRRVEQALMRVLAVQIEQRRHDRAQLRDRYHFARHAADAAAALQNLAANGQKTVLGFQPHLRKRALYARQRGNIEKRLDPSAFRAARDAVAIGFSPRTKSSEPTMMLLPAPVSPVSTVSPGPKDSVSRSISAISRIESCRSTYFIIPLKRSATSGADSTSRRMTRIVLSPASVPTTSFQRIVSTISAAACAPPGSVLMTIWLQA